MKTTPLFLIAATALVVAAAAAAESMVPLKIPYPKPAQRGTPKPIPLRDYEPARKKAPEFLAPRGTVLLSVGKPVRASDKEPLIGDLAMITDGDTTGIDGTYVELGPGVQWVEIDLGASARIHAIALWHFHAEERVYHDVIVQVSSAPSFAGKVATLFNNDADNSSKRGAGKDRPYAESNYGRLIEAHGAVGRYVRLYSNGNTSDEMNHYCEVEVYGQWAR